MTNRRQKKLVHEGDYVAEVEVELIDTPGGWSPYLSLEDAYKLDEVREALRQGDFPRAAKLGRVYRLTPVAELGAALPQAAHVTSPYLRSLPIPPAESPHHR